MQAERPDRNLVRHGDDRRAPAPSGRDPHSPLQPSGTSERRAGRRFPQAGARVPKNARGGGACPESNSRRPEANISRHVPVFHHNGRNGFQSLPDLIFSPRLRRSFHKTPTVTSRLTKIYYNNPFLCCTAPLISLMRILMLLHTVLVLPDRCFGVERVAARIFFFSKTPPGANLFLERNLDEALFQKHAAVRLRRVNYLSRTRSI